MINEGEQKIIAIVAPTNGGKTELSKRVAQILGDNAVIYSYDEHDLYPSGTDNLKKLMESGSPSHWEDPNLFDNGSFLANLSRWRMGMPIILPANSRESMAAGLTTREVEPRRINIVEGVFVLFFTDAREVYDLSFYIDIPEDEMVKRRLNRTPKGSFDPWDNYEYITGPMIQGTRDFVVPQKEYAHSILDGLKPIDQLANEVITRINNL